MSDISKSELSQLLGDNHLGEEAYFLDILSRWDSLRVLDYLFSEGSASTGEIARGINMDMREVRDTLNALSDVDIVTAEEDPGQTVYWKPTTREVRIAITSDGGLEIAHTMQSTPPHRENTTNSHNSVDGVFTKTGKKLDTLLDRLR